jgi:hypothetical protein
MIGTNPATDHHVEDDATIEASGRNHIHGLIADTFGWI